MRNHLAFGVTSAISERNSGLRWAALIVKCNLGVKEYICIYIIFNATNGNRRTDYRVINLSIYGYTIINLFFLPINANF